jgi:hypothetical protein
MHGNAPVGAMTSSQRLDRSNDGQDHTVSPYASFLLRLKASQDMAPLHLKAQQAWAPSVDAVCAMLTRFISPCTHKSAFNAARVHRNPSPRS